jgi:integrase
MVFAKEKTDLAPHRGELLVPNPKLRLREQLREVMRFKHYSLRTEETYWGWIRQFILFHGKRHPREMGPAEVHSFLTHLAANRNVAVSTQNQALNAVVFLYKQVLHQPLGDFSEAVRASKPRRVPVVLSREEVRPWIEETLNVQLSTSNV